MLKIRFVLVIGFFTRIACVVGQTDKCQISSNGTSAGITLDECLAPFATKWNEVRTRRGQLDSIVYPLLALAPDDLRVLCSQVDQAKRQCGGVVETCDSHPIARVVQQNFQFGCDQQVSLFFNHSNCLLSTVNGRQDCMNLLRRNEGDTGNGSVCSQAERFFKCVHDDVHKSCQGKGLAALVHAIDRLGCDAKQLDAGVQNDATTCSNEEWQQVANCFQPLLSLWSAIRDNDTSFLDTAFPLFKFQRADVVKMCELVRVTREQCFLQIQRCPGHQLPEFVNAILGVPCGKQSDFLLSFDCIKTVIVENEQCRPYTVGAWQPGHLKEICGRMPQYYKCLERPMVTRCFHDGLGILAQAIRQYGCQLNTDDTRTSVAAGVPPTVVVTTSTTITAPPTAPTLAASAQSTPSGQLDFAAFTPSHQLASPGPAVAPGVASDRPDPQPFLQGPQLAPASLVPSLAPPPPQALFNPVDANQLQPIPPSPSIQAAPPASLLAESPQAAPPSTPTAPVQNSGRVEVGPPQQQQPPSIFPVANTAQPVPVQQQPSQVPVQPQPPPILPTANAAQPVSVQQQPPPVVTGSPALPIQPVTPEPPASAPIVSGEQVRLAVQVPASEQIHFIQPPAAPILNTAPLLSTLPVATFAPAVPPAATPVATPPTIVSSTFTPITTPSTTPTPTSTTTPKTTSTTTTSTSTTTTPTTSTTTTTTPTASAPTSIVVPVPQGPVSSVTDVPIFPTSPPTKGTVIPIPTSPHLFDKCNVEKRNKLRDCLNPLYTRWLEVHGRMMAENGGMNLSFPIFHYTKTELVDLCDQYASAFLQCPLSIFLECLTDDVVYLANAIFGYICSPQNIPDVSRYFDCISFIVKKREQCTLAVQGPLTVVAHQAANRCQGAKNFHSCNRLQIDQSCTSGAEKVFTETIKQFGCQLS